MLLTIIGFGLFMAVGLTHAEQYNLGADYYFVVVPVYVGALWVAIEGILGA